MADYNDFLNKLFAPPEPSSPMDSESAMRGREELLRQNQMLKQQVPEEIVAPAHAPRMAQPVAIPTKEVAAEEIQKEEINPPKADQPELDLALPKNDEMSKYKQLLEQYNSRNTNLGLLQGANQIAQAVAAGYGGKIGDGSESVEMLRKMNKDPLAQIQDEDAAQLNDPTSDVSKFYRQQAYAYLKKIDPSDKYAGQLDDMSAAQLMKLPGLKNVASQASPWIATDRVDRNGNPIRFNKITGEYTLADGTSIKPGDFTTRDITKKNAYGLYERQSDLINNSGSSPQALPTISTPSGEAKPKEVSYTDLFQRAPEQAKEFNKIRDQFNKDMKDSREVATSVTNLASKLKPGKNGEVDSGLLGGIQTQAAKMAGQKGVLTDQDLVKFAGAGGVKAKLERIADNLQGDMSDSDIKFFKRFAQLMGKSLNEDILNRSQLYVEQGRQIADTALPGVSSDNIAKILGVDKVAPIVQNKPMVKMKLPNGKIVNIPEENVEAAKKRGASEVK